MSLQSPKPEPAFVDYVDALKQRVGLLPHLFPHQRKFVLDGAKRKAALCSRRAGKTTAVAVALLEVARNNPGSICVYISLTRLSAKRILWPALKKLTALAPDVEVRFNHSELSCIFSNGAQLWITGADDDAQIDKLRGSAYHLVVIDEAASFGPHLDTLVDEVLEPALLDHNGTLALIGTPGAACTGKFHDITTGVSGASWGVHRWTVLDNPHIPTAGQWLQQRKIENGWDDEHPIYRREWLGHWVLSLDSLVYRFTGANLCDDFAADGRDWVHTLGVDLGFDDDSAFQICSSSPQKPECYLHSGSKQSGMNVTQVAERIQGYLNRWPIHRVVIDTGGIGKMVAEELTARFNLPVKAAEKADKLGAIELLNGDLHSKRVMVVRNEPVLREWQVLQWDADDRRKEDGRFPNHLSDASLYAYREAIHWAHRPVSPPPETGTPAFVQADEDAMEEENTRNPHKNDGFLVDFA